MSDILLAEDDRAVRNGIVALLERAGHSVRAFRNGDQALASYRERRPDLVILDVMMPVKDGLMTCREIRETDAETPILFLSALDGESDELSGLGVGADDYIFKTASDERVLARVQAALRRVYKPEARGDFSIGSCRVNVTRLLLVRKDSSSVELSEREVALLRLFASKTGEVFTRDFLITRFWDSEEDVSDNTLSIAVHKLRDKLGADGAALKTVRSVGYVFRA